MKRSVFKNKQIIYYLIGGGVSRLGDVLSGLAFLFITYDLTGSKLHTTGMVIAETIPYLFFGLFGGVVADWVSKKRLLIIIDFIRVPILLSVVGCFYFEILTYPLLLVAGFVIQSFGCFFNPAHRSILPLLAKEDELTTVNSLNDTVTRGITVLSPIIAIFLLRTVGPIHFFTIDAITYLISVWCISRLNFEDIRYSGERTMRAVFISISDFAKWAYQHLTIRNLFYLTFFIVFFNTWVWQVGILLAYEEMSSNGEELYSVFQGVFGLTVIISNILIPFIFKKMSLKTYLLGSTIWALGIVYVGVTFSIVNLFIGAVIVAIGLPITGLTRVYILQKYVPTDKLGRGFSFNAVLLYLSNTISLSLFGLLSTFLSVQTLFLICGLAMLVPSILVPLMYITKLLTKRTRRAPVKFFK